MLITCPQCKYSSDVNDDKIPAKAALATCPQCGHKFVFRDIPDGEEFLLEEAGDEQEAAESPETALETMDVPWERTDKYGFFGGMLQTIKLVLFSAPMFFRSMPQPRGLKRPLGFALLLQIFFHLTYGLLEYLTGSQTLIIKKFFSAFSQEQGALVMAQISQYDSLIGIVVQMLLALLLTVPFILVVGGIVHFMLFMLRAAKGSYGGTVSALCYTYATSVLGLIPYLGPVVAGVWGTVVTAMALKNVHRTTYLRIFILIPLGLLLCVLFGLCFGLLVAGCTAMTS